MESKKIDANTIEITKTFTKKDTYLYKELIERKAQIIEARDKNAQSFNDQIAEIDLILAECVKVGVSDKIT